MSDVPLRERIAAVIALVLGADHAAQPWDSLQQIEVVLAIEDEFGVTIAEADIPQLQTTEDVAAHIEGLGAAR